MNDFPKKQLLIHYLLGICTVRERDEVEHWLDEHPDHVAMLQETARKLGKNRTFPVPERNAVKNELFRKISDPVFSENALSAKQRFTPQANRRKHGWFKLAAMLLLISLAGFAAFYLGINEIPTAQQEPALNHRALSHGQTATLRFGDGSEIQLNGGSTLRYPETFAPDRREVYLDGEAFFRVAEDQSRPFIIHAGNTITEVMGTTFNIKAYEDEGEIQVAVATGKVKVLQTDNDDVSSAARYGNTHSGEAIFLEKNQWVTYHSASGILERGEGSIWEMIAWKDRVLLFSNKSFANVAKMLERWYGVQITIEDASLRNNILEGEHQDVSLEGVLKSIRFVMDFDYEINENEVRIY